MNNENELNNPNYTIKVEWYDYWRLNIILISVIFIDYYNTSANLNLLIVAIICVLISYIFLRKLKKILFYKNYFIVEYLIEKRRTYKVNYNNISKIKYISFSLRAGPSIQIKANNKWIEIAYLNRDNLLDFLRERGVNIVTV